MNPRFFIHRIIKNTKNKVVSIELGRKEGFVLVMFPTKNRLYKMGIIDNDIFYVSRCCGLRTNIRNSNRVLETGCPSTISLEQVVYQMPTLRSEEGIQFVFFENAYAKEAIMVWRHVSLIRYGNRCWTKLHLLLKQGQLASRLSLWFEANWIGFGQDGQIPRQHQNAVDARRFLSMDQLSELITTTL